MRKGRATDGRAEPLRQMRLRPGTASLSARYAMRPVELADAEALLEWRNDFETRRLARTQGVISLRDHMKWLEAAIADEARLYRVLWDVGAEADVPLASVRYDLEPDTGCAEVSILVAPTGRGRGIGRVALEQSLPELRQWRPEVTEVLAVVHENNLASRRLFESTGYTYRDSDGDWRTYVLAL